jgi:TRAP-type C4-dicarboxylate transport system permease small subunit
MSGKIDKFERFVNSLSNWLNWVAGAALVAMLAVIVADVIGAKVLKWPIPGGIEMVGFLGVIVIAFAIAHTQVLRGHIEVEFLVMRLPQTAQRAIAGTVYLLGMALFGLLAWRSYDFARTLQVKGEVSMTQEIPFYLFIYGIALCSISVFLVLLVQCIRAVTKMKP